MSVLVTWIPWLGRNSFLKNFKPDSNDRLYKEFIHLFCCCHEHTKRNLIFLWWFMVFDSLFTSILTVWSWIHKKHKIQKLDWRTPNHKTNCGWPETSLMRSVSKIHLKDDRNALEMMIVVLAVISTYYVTNRILSTLCVLNHWLSSPRRQASLSPLYRWGKSGSKRLTNLPMVSLL